MAEFDAFNLCSRVLKAINSPANRKAYEKGLSFREAKYDFARLGDTIHGICSLLLDAQKKQEGSVAVKELITRMKVVLYDAEDLFDEVATDELLKQQIDESFLEGRLSFIKLNLISGRSIARKVGAIRHSLDDIYVDMTSFNFEIQLAERPISSVRRKQGPRSLVNTKNLIGRDEDKKTILEMLGKESDNVPAVIAIVGIGGTGKTALAELIADDNEIKATFEKVWFACISDTSDEKEIIEQIFQSISGGSYDGFLVSQLQTDIRKSTADKKFLLVLDEVWDDNPARWLDRISLLRGGAKGSKVIVTTRYPSVAQAAGAVASYNLEGLSEEDSWDLFKRLAFYPEDENDQRRIALGREIVKKGRNVPLAITDIASLLYETHDIRAWEFFKDQELGELLRDPAMSELKVSYHHLPSNMKNCFAYCSLFPKDLVFHVPSLINLWISQGYIKPHNDLETLEQAGYSDFMHLLSRGFFQEPEIIDEGRINRCKMHDLIHDLALHVAGNESYILKCTSSSDSYFARHVSIHDSIDNTWVIPRHLHNGSQLRSLLFMNRGSICSSTLDQLCANLKLLRSLDLQAMGLEYIPSCVGEMKHLRYLDLSCNNFESLPESMTNLLNLLTLILTECTRLKALPDNFRKLIKLRNLNIDGCFQLKHMPARLGELTGLQYLSHFYVGKAASEEDGVKKSGLDELAGLKLLRGKLSIEFQRDWDGDECNWQLPQSLEQLNIFDYPGKRMADWGMHGRTNSLASLCLFTCRNVINLSPLRCLANLRSLFLFNFWELEFMEEESQNSCITVEGSCFFPRLEYFSLDALPKLKGWWRKPPTSTPSFPCLRELEISSCPRLKSFPLCECLQALRIYDTGGNKVLEQMLSGLASAIPPSSSSLPSSSCFREMLISPHLRTLEIVECGSLEMLHVAAPQLQQLQINYFSQLKKLHIANPNALEVLEIGPSLKELELWEEDNRGVDWDSLSNLRNLYVCPVPPPEKLPQCLRHRQALGQLLISPSQRPEEY